MPNFAAMSPKEVRAMIRSGGIDYSTRGMCDGYAQANLISVPKEYAYDFLIFAQRNPKPCPLLDVTDPGGREFCYAAPGSDVAKDIPRYRVYREGVFAEELTDASDYFEKYELVSFLLGCSYSFESLLVEEGIVIPNMIPGGIVPMYTTNIRCRPSGVFDGPTVVSMRPIPGDQVTTAVLATARLPQVHGTPIWVGDPAVIGIADIMRPEYGGEAVEIAPGSVPVFWACGVTPQAVVLEAKLPFAITHAPGHMFITDLKNKNLAKA